MTGIKTAKARKQRDEAVELLRAGLKEIGDAWRAKVKKFIARFEVRAEEEEQDERG